MLLAPAFTVLCGLLVVAGTSKVVRPGYTREALARIKVSVPLIGVRALGIAEIALGAIAGLGASRLTASLVAAAFGGFCVVVVTSMRVGKRGADCGCFGRFEGDLGALHVGLNAVGFAVAGLAAISPPPGGVWMVSRPPLIALPLCLGVAAAILAAHLAYTRLATAWRAYGLGVRREWSSA